MSRANSKSRKRYLGMTKPQITILSVMAMLNCTVLGAAATILLGSSGTAPAMAAADTPPLQASSTPLPTYTERPTSTQAATRTPTWTPTRRPTNTPAPTRTPKPTNTMRPTNTATISFKAQAQTLGPIWDSGRDESYSAQVSVSNVRFSFGEGYSKPKRGYVYLIVDVTLKNLGPGSMYSVGAYDFQVRDANGALRDQDLLANTSDCRMDLVDLGAGGSISGCIGFEVPADGKLELIYAPYNYEALEPGRHLSFVLRR